MASQNDDPMADGEHAKSSDEQRRVDPGSHSVAKRLQQELMTLMVYENLVYRLRLEFPSCYPYESPLVTFETPCFHPNVDAQGNICLDILREKWTALLDVRTVLLSIQSLLAEPNVSSPLNGYAAELWSNQVLYKKVLLEKYAKKNKKPES
ncbi:ubiquitin-conjugating enzyme E2 C isoform X3 [Rhipicephalus microplus]|uniref:ubiquitin-conjugating enzyme E2 C isoform X3 n=1 Tax=Rhipicephalus microplus TaxID=6941 RepID=UPI003F6D027B